ncbi:GAF domain protein [Hyphomonas neptunium ATCC 15444]|uniref:GAF domain protein n=2 Tax=Hyphomonas TaxID=85 RepID=Q0C5I2_HYPNA|nr:MULTISPECIES: GAF domain-containing protein [Hyphomonas]ABI77734.1 GAF domain protein [Hyphomonas neptunium ATCC 15444]KCZ95439.1 GAF domain-containing protein [Hyphomonas hirschiana VP5]
MTRSSPALPLAAQEVERERVDFLHTLGILDTPPDARIDAITREAADYFKVPMALVTLIDSDSQWIKSNTGLIDFQGPRAIAFCHHTIQRLRLLVVENALADPRFCDNPMVRNPPHIRFYAGAPLVVGGRYRLGSFCLLDDIPRTLDTEGRSRLWQFATTASQLIEEIYMSRPAPEHTHMPFPSRRYS